MEPRDATLEGLLAWRCGYAMGLRVALQLMQQCDDPPARILREIQAATAEAQGAEQHRPSLRLD